MKYREEWKGRLRVDSMDVVYWDGVRIGEVRPRSKPGHVTPGGMQTNLVFDSLQYGLSLEHATKDLALQSLIDNREGK